MEAFKTSLSLVSLNLSGLRHDKQTVSLINDTVCYNQGELAQYSFLAGEKHKLMKDELRNGSPDQTKVKLYKEELESHLNSELKKIINENFKRIMKYFEGRSERAPRICIKVAQEDAVKDFFREDNRFYIRDYKREDNTGFASVYARGKYYLCNNIPYEVKAGRYINPRLNIRKAAQYKKQQIFNWLSQKRNKEDAKWIACWEESKINGSSLTPLAEQCYKSTIIIPMTLLGNALSHEFKSQFKIGVGDDAGRAIYGFLCIDHHHTNYFKPDIDVSVGYIFADLISLYLITNLIYIDYSKTFKIARESLN